MGEHQRQRQPIEVTSSFQRAATNRANIAALENPPRATTALDIQTVERQRLEFWCLDNGINPWDDGITVEETPLTVDGTPPWIYQAEHTRQMMRAGIIIDQSWGCEIPTSRNWEHRDDPSDHRTYLKPCGKCATCAHRKRTKRRRRIYGKIHRECDRAHRTWFNTRTFDWKSILVYLRDTDVITDDRPELSREDKDFAAKWFFKNERKRLRAQPDCPPFRQGTAWERHKSGDLHAHSVIHEQTSPIVEYRQFAASFIVPKRATPKPPPRRIMRDNDGNAVLDAAGNPTPAETDHQYYKRLVWDYLWPGHRAWIKLRDDTTPEAREKRLRLPFQPGRFDSDLIKDPKRIARYTGKTARYAAKEGGAFHATPGRKGGTPAYGYRDPPTAAGTSAPADQLGASSPDQRDPSVHTRTASAVTGRLLSQDTDAFGAGSTPPDPLNIRLRRKARGPPTRSLALRTHLSSFMTP